MKCECHLRKKKNGASTCRPVKKDQVRKPEHGHNLISITPYVVYHVTLIPMAFYMDNDHGWWIDSGTTIQVHEDRCFLKDYELVDYGSML